MDFNLILIMCFLVLGCGYTSYRIGVMQGIKATVSFIEDNELIEFDDDIKNDT
jgi:hypothetical protein